jgi:hypothetical protein
MMRQNESMTPRVHVGGLLYGTEFSDTGLTRLKKSYWGCVPIERKKLGKLGQKDRR